MKKLLALISLPFLFLGVWYALVYTMCAMFGLGMHSNDGSMLVWFISFVISCGIFIVIVDEMCNQELL